MKFSNSTGPMALVHPLSHELQASKLAAGRYTFHDATSVRKEVMNMANLNDFDYAGISADQATRSTSSSHEKQMAESLRSLALGMQLLQRQVDRIEALLKQGQ